MKGQYQGQTSRYQYSLLQGQNPNEREGEKGCTFVKQKIDLCRKLVCELPSKAETGLTLGGGKVLYFSSFPWFIFIFVVPT